MELVVKLNSVSLQDRPIVGGKNASLGEMIQHLSSKGINVPNGFATTTYFYDQFIERNHLQALISQTVSDLQISNIAALTKTANTIQHAIGQAEFSQGMVDAIATAYQEINEVPVAVRSSAVTEDLANASFAGQQETFLNIQGIEQLTKTIKGVFASLFSSRAIAYRLHHGFGQDVSISVGIQPMIRSDLGVSGVIFTLDTESGFDGVILISASYGLGETIVQGKVNPDEFFVSKEALKQNRFAILKRECGNKACKMVYTQSTEAGLSTKFVNVNKQERARFCLSDDEIHTLARQALVIEDYYKKPMDIEWAKDGITGELFILQARPETVKSASNTLKIENYILKQQSRVIVTGQGIGQKISSGVSRIILDPKKMHELQEGEILVTDMTDPDWEPVLKKAAGIVTNRGGRTCHAAIIARELAIPAVIGCNNATEVIDDKNLITLSCAEGNIGYVYEGKLSYEVEHFSVDALKPLASKLCLNIGHPEKAFAFQALPNEGVGLARLEFIINQSIGIHPKALLDLPSLPEKLKNQIKKRIAAYSSPNEFYIEKLREGISTIAAAFFPKPVIFRFSDFKSNEYRNLLGGHLFEPIEENPMMGFRGASRYKNEMFKECFWLECEAFKRVRNQMGLTNAYIMVPFVRTVEELNAVLALMEKNGLKRGENYLKIFMMCEIPSNALLAKAFLENIDGFSIGSNDLTQLTLGLDRDSSLIADQFNEANDAVKMLIKLAITECKRQGKYIGICGQAPSDNLEFATWLIHEGIEAISLNPDCVVKTWSSLAQYDVTSVTNIKQSLSVPTPVY